MSKRRATPKPKRKRTTLKAVQETEHLPAPVPTVTVTPEVDDDPHGDDGLTERQRKFVDAYIGPAGGNATKAASMAGYKDDNTPALRACASRLLTFANVQTALARAIARRRLSPEWAREGLTEVASSSMANFVTVNSETGETQLDMKRAIEAGALGQIKEYREEVLSVNGAATVLKRTVKIHDRTQALATLLRLQGQLPDANVHEHVLVNQLIADPEAAGQLDAVAHRMADLARRNGASSN
jgi:phage terminase small subunit